MNIMYSTSVLILGLLISFINNGNLKYQCSNNKFDITFPYGRYQICESIDLLIKSFWCECYVLYHCNNWLIVTKDSTNLNPTIKWQTMSNLFWDHLCLNAIYLETRALNIKYSSPCILLQGIQYSQHKCCISKEQKY